MTNLNRKKWVAALNECDSHILRIQHAINHLADKLPLSKEVYNFLSDRDIAYIDQIVFRFSKWLDFLSNPNLAKPTGRIRVFASSLDNSKRRRFGFIDYQI